MFGFTVMVNKVGFPVQVTPFTNTEELTLTCAVKGVVVLALAAVTYWIPYRTLPHMSVVPVTSTVSIKIVGMTISLAGMATM